MMSHDLRKTGPLNIAGIGGRLRHMAKSDAQEQVLEEKDKYILEAFEENVDAECNELL